MKGDEEGEREQPSGYEGLSTHDLIGLKGGPLPELSPPPLSCPLCAHATCFPAPEQPGSDAARLQSVHVCPVQDGGRGLVTVGGSCLCWSVKGAQQAGDWLETRAEKGGAPRGSDGRGLGETRSVAWQVTRKVQPLLDKRRGLGKEDTAVKLRVCTHWQGQLMVLSSAPCPEGRRRGPRCSHRGTWCGGGRGKGGLGIPAAQVGGHVAGAGQAPEDGDPEFAVTVSRVMGGLVQSRTLQRGEGRRALRPVTIKEILVQGCRHGAFAFAVAVTEPSLLGSYH